MAEIEPIRIGNHFVRRVGSIPMVLSAIDQISTIYNRSKESSNLLKYTFEKAENGVVIVAKTATSTHLVNKMDSFVPYIDKLDTFACSKLDTIEHKYPIVNAPTEEVYNAVKQYVCNKVDPILSYADKTVDYYVPAIEAEQEEDNVANKNVSGKVVAISNKLRRRMYVRALSQVKGIQLRSKEAVDRLTHTVNLIDYAKTVDGKVRYVWNEIQKSEEDVEHDQTMEQSNSNDNAETIEKRIIATARHLTIHLKRTISAFSTVKVLPASLSDQLIETRKFTNDLYWSLSHVRNHSYRASLTAVNQCSIILQAFKLEDVPQVVLENARIGLQKFQENLTYATDYLLYYIGKRKEASVNENGTPENLQTHDENKLEDNSNF